MARLRDLSILTHFAPLVDPRVERTRHHPLLDIVSIAICAMIAGAETWVDMEKFGKAKLTWLQSFLALPNGIPSHDTFGRVFAHLDPLAFQECFQRWVDSLRATLGLKRIAIDGKTLRRSFDRANGKAALHLVSAWATENHLSLGQVAVDDKSNEIVAIPQLLEILDLAGALVTIDAMGCQTEIARKIREGGGHYLLAVKENQPHLYEDIENCFILGFDSGFVEMDSDLSITEDKGHGRQERRECFTITDPEGIRGWAAWKDAKQIGLIVQERTEGGKTSLEKHYFISSQAGTAAALGRHARGHWGIENGLHWIMDVVFDEDQSRVRKDHGPQNLAFLRRIALSLLKRHSGKGSVRGKRLQAGWNEKVLEEILMAR